MEGNSQSPSNTRLIVYVVLAIVAVVAIGIFASAGCREYSRYQTRQDAGNQVKVAHIEIEKAEEEAKVNQAQIKATEAEARKRVAESIGIKKAQVEIDKTLTPLYVQHEYVQAIERASNSPSNTVEFIPVGPSGIPIVKPTSP